MENNIHVCKMLLHLYIKCVDKLREILFTYIFNFQESERKFVWKKFFFWGFLLKEIN